LKQLVGKLPHYLTILLTSLLLFQLPVCGQNESPKHLLDEADRLAWLDNWVKAGPLYEQAERLFGQSGDIKGTLYARIGKTYATMQSQSFPDLSRRLALEMQNPIIQNDPRLKLRWLVTKAEIDIEIDPSAAQHGWEEIQALALRLGDKAWEARARGKLGYIAFFQGDIYRTQELMREAFYSAESLGDLGAQIWYATVIGNGLGELGLHDQALKFLDEALRSAEGNKDAGFPFLAYAGKAQSLAELKNRSEAKKMLEKGLREAQSFNRRLEEAYYLIVLAKLSASDNNLPLAIAYLETTRNLCVDGGFHHTLAWSMFELAKIYRDSGNLQKAEERATLAMNAMRQVQDQYHLPLHLALLAELAVKLLHDQPGDARHFVVPAMAEIDDLLRMAERPRRINRPAGMAGISSRGGVALGHGLAQSFGTDLAREASVAEALEPSVPSVNRHPDFNLDIGVG
jgi:tetratricopeptide (TPR) repeat protein